MVQSHNRHCLRALFKNIHIHKNKYFNLDSPHNSRHTPIRLSVVQRQAYRSPLFLDHHAATVTLWQKNKH